MGLSRRPEPALIVPDEETWLAWRAADADPVHSAGTGRARVLVLPERVPHALAGAVRCAWALMPAARSARVYDAPLAGAPARELLGGLPHDARCDDASREAAENDGADHGDMMAFTGEPSADGLVMERLDVRVGPLAAGLPGGLVVDATLDGDVVAACRVRPILHAGPGGAARDPWAATAWSIAERAARERAPAVAASGDRWLELAALETERAVSHLAWLHGFCRLLGWARMTGRIAPVLAATGAVRAAVAAARAQPGQDLTGRAEQRRGAEEAQTGAAALAGALAASRSFGMRTAGLAELTREDVLERRLAGPLARAGGVGEDARADDPGYRLLGFEPLAGADGDARARALVRAAEAAQALGLAAAAIGRAGQPSADGAAGPRFSRGTAGIAESARGPLLVSIDADGSPRRAAPGAGAACDAAGELAAGHEWSAALVTIASFDLSPWRVTA